VSRRVVAQPSFQSSLAALPATAEVASALQMLVQYATRYPENARALWETTIHGIRSSGQLGGATLTLYYAFDEDTLYLVHVHLHDALEHARGEH
jgi:hypothetical protein